MYEKALAGSNCLLEYICGLYTSFSAKGEQSTAGVNILALRVYYEILLSACWTCQTANIPTRSNKHEPIRTQRILRVVPVKIPPWRLRDCDFNIQRVTLGLPRGCGRPDFRRYAVRACFHGIEGGRPDDG